MHKRNSFCNRSQNNIIAFYGLSPVQQKQRKYATQFKFSKFDPFELVARVKPRTSKTQVHNH